MEYEFEAKCLNCGNKFKVSDGGGFIFHLLHCDTCGKEKSISFEKLGELHLKYLKGLNVPYCLAISEHDRYIQENYKGDSISEEEYYKAIENKFKNCKCGGRFKFKAKPRCPKCKSKDFKNIGKNQCFYD